MALEDYTLLHSISKVYLTKLQVNMPINDI